MAAYQPCLGVAHRGTMVGIAILGERPGGAALAGIALVAAGIVLLVTNRRHGRVAVDSPGP